MPTQLATLVLQSFGCIPEALTHRLSRQEYSVALPDHDIAFLVRPPTVLVLAWLDSKGHRLDQEWRFRINSVTAIGYALAHFNELDSDKKLWLHDRFKLHLAEARASGSQFWRSQLLLAADVQKGVEKYVKKRKD